MYLLKKLLKVVKNGTMKEFKPGDKVKIPKTKKGHEAPWKSSVCIRQAQDAGQDFLYVIKTMGGTISLRHEPTSTGGDFFDISEVELYEEIEKNEIEIFTFFGISNSGKDIFLVSEKDGTTSLRYKSN